MKTLTRFIGVIAMMAVACSDSHVEQGEVSVFVIDVNPHDYRKR